MGVLGRGMVVVFALASLSSCLDATEIIVELGTDVACATVNGVAISVGAPGDDDAGIVKASPLCSPDGSLGSIAVLPSGAIDDPVGIRVTLGIDAAAQDCRPPNFDGCIVARRALRYDPHTPLTLPIDLDQSCIGVPCSPYSTCSSGACVDASIPACTGVCTLPDAGTTPPPPPTRILMFGGSTDCSGAAPVLLTDAWSWDGTSWTPDSVASFGTRYLEAVSSSGTGSVLFGGFGAANTFLGDTWVRSGTTWTSSSQTPPVPAVRAFFAMAESNGAAMMFGGLSGTTTLGDTWNWTGSAWNVQNVNGPPARFGHAMATRGSKVVLFGGTAAPTFDGSRFADTWEYDGTTWTPSTATGPPGRDGHVMATLGNTTVMFGGEYFMGTGFVGLSDTWLWDGTSWTSHAGTNPSALWFSAMAPLGNKLVLFGGVDGNTGLPTNHTYEFDGATMTWSIKTVTNPPARCGHVMVPVP